MITEQISADENAGKNERQSANWDLRNAFRNYSTLVVTQIVVAFFSFASVWLATRYLGTEGYGGVFAIIAASQVAHILVHWTSTAIIRFGTEEFIETEKIARIFWVRLFILLPNILLVFVVSSLWFPPLAGWLKLTPGTFWLVILHFAASALWIHFQYSLQAVKKPRLQGGLLAIEKIFIFAGLFILTATGRLNVFSTALCYASAPLVMSLSGFWFLRQFIFARFSADWEFRRKILVYSIPLFPSVLLWYFSGGYADAIFISKFLSIQTLGVYSVATQINGMALQLPTLANSLLLPLFVSLQKEAQFQRLQNYFRHTFPTLILCWGILITIAAFLGYFAIPAIFGSEFATTVEPLWILLAASTLNLPVLIGYSALSHTTSTTYISMLSATFAALTNIGLNLLLIPVFGMKGCAWATAIMYFVSSLVYAVFLRKDAKTPVSWAFAAMFPTVGGAVVFSLTGNPWLSLGVCLTAAVFVIYLKKTSFRESILFLKKFRNL